MFQDVCQLFAQYNARLLDNCRGGSGPAFESEYLIEAQQRLDQLAFVVGRVQALSEPSAASRAWAAAQYESQLATAPHLRSAANSTHMSEYLEHLEDVAPAVVSDLEMRVLAEAFYYIAWRTVQVLRKLPGLKAIRADGIRGVRNQLLEHPEGKDSGVIENGYSWDRSTGPVIKGVRRSDKVEIFPDAGLYANALEFAANLREHLEGLLRSPEACSRRAPPSGRAAR